MLTTSGKHPVFGSEDRMQGLDRYIQGLPVDLQARMKACENMEDVLLIARAEGLELPDEALDMIYGGCGTSYTYKVDDYRRCKECATKVTLRVTGHDGFPDIYFCPVCYRTKDTDETERYYNRRKVPK